MSAPQPHAQILERREARQELVRVAEYERCTRTGPRAELSIGFTRDVSRNGLCLGVDHPERIGAHLQVTLRHRGRRTRPARARVAWCAPAYGGRWWLGLDLGAAPQAHR